MKKVIIFTVFLIPIIIGIVGCYVFTAKLLSLAGDDWESQAIVGAFYFVQYLFLFMPVVFSIGVIAAIYLLYLLNDFRYKIGVILLFLLFLVFLVVMPFFIEKLLHNHFKEKIQTQRSQQQKML